MTVHEKAPSQAILSKDSCKKSGPGSQTFTFTKEKGAICEKMARGGFFVNVNVCEPAPDPEFVLLEDHPTVEHVIDIFNIVVARKEIGVGKHE